MPIDTIIFMFSSSSKSDPLLLSLSLARYSLSPLQVENLADEFYGKVMEAAGVESGNGGASFGGDLSSSEPTNQDITISFKDKGHKSLFVEVLDSTFLRPAAT
jgi:hypothetical protein